MWLIYSLLSGFFAALTAVFSKIGVNGINSNLATAIRTIVILVLISTIISITGEIKSINSLTKHNIIFLVLSGGATGLSWLFYFKALQVGKVSQVVAVDKLSVVMAIILSVIFLKESLSIKTVIGVLLICGGAWVISA